jgi:hypothetical protein
MQPGVLVQLAINLAIVLNARHSIMEKSSLYFFVGVGPPKIKFSLPIE